MLVIAIAIIGVWFLYNKEIDNKEVAALRKLGITKGEVRGMCADCNIILLSVDSLRADHVSALGYKRDTTPNLDKFAEQGALFLNYFSTSFLTPVSEASVQTGLYPTSHGVTNFDTVLPKNKVTLTRYLKAKNYETSTIMTSPEFEFYPAIKQGFSGSFDRYRYINPDRKIDASKYRQFPTESDLSSELTVLGGNKFLLWLSVGGVHWPYGWTAENVYADPNYKGILKDRLLDWEGAFKHIYKWESYPSGKKLTDADVQYVRDEYDNGVRTFDDFLGVLLKELKRRNLLEKTVIVIESEHGEDLGEHGYFAHYDVLDTQTHTPLLIYIPTLQKGQEISSLSSGVDVLPTIMEILGDVVPNWIEGKSLLPVITGREQDGERKEVFMERVPLWEEADLTLRKSLEARGIKVMSGKDKDIAIRTTEWKYILRLSRAREEEVSWWATLTGKPVHVPEAELYNLADDPMETLNVISQYPEEVKALRTRVEDWFENISSGAPEPGLQSYIQPYF